MRGRHPISVGLALAGLVALASPSFGGPAVASRWRPMTLTHEECLKNAEEAIRKTGLERLERTTQSRYGTQREYTGAVRCIPEHNIVMFIGSGPSRQIADQLAGALFENF